LNKEWFNSTPVYIFIDTSVIINLGFDFEHRYFKTIKAGVDANDLKLVTTDILKNEFLKHCQEKIDKDKKTIKDIHFVKHYLKNEFSDLESKVLQITADTFWNFFTTKLATIDITSEVSWKPVFDNFFNQRSPFGSSCPISS